MNNIIILAILAFAVYFMMNCKNSSVNENFGSGPNGIQCNSNQQGVNSVCASGVCQANGTINGRPNVQGTCVQGSLLKGKRCGYNQQCASNNCGIPRGKSLKECM